MLLLLTWPTVGLGRAGGALEVAAPREDMESSGTTAITRDEKAAPPSTSPRLLPRDTATDADGRDARRPPLTEEMAKEIPADRFTQLFTPSPPPPMPAAGWAYTAYGAAAFIPVGGWTAAGLVAGGSLPFLATGVNALAAAGLGALPARLGAVYSNPVEARWRDVDVALFGLSLLLTPPLAGLGAWASQGLFFGGHTAGGRAYAGATLGALVGHLVGMGLETLLRDRLPLPELAGYRLLLAVSSVGTGAALGQALFSPGPR